MTLPSHFNDWIWALDSHTYSLPLWSAAFLNMSLLLLWGEPAHHMRKTSLFCRLLQTVDPQFYVSIISHGNLRNCTSLRSLTCSWLWLKMTEQWKNIKGVLIGWHTSWQKRCFYFWNMGLVSNSVNKVYETYWNINIILLLLSNSSEF